jgi:hypothetical protein
VIVDHVGKSFVVSISQPGELPRAVVVAATCLVSLSNTSNSAEFGASPYPKGFRDIYAGVVPTVRPFSITFGDTETNIGDTGITPITLGWHGGNFYWNAGLCIFAPTGKYDKRDLANTSLNHWSVIPSFAITYFDAKAIWHFGISLGTGSSIRAADHWS